MLTEADIILALRDCFDPVLPCNIIDLGQLRSVHVLVDRDAPGANIPGVPCKHIVHIELATSSADDTARAQLRGQIVNRLAGIETVGRTSVVFSDRPAWTPLDISPAGRKTLGLDGNPHLVQIR